MKAQWDAGMSPLKKRYFKRFFCSVEYQIF
jgi:hypothetical protein